MARARWDPCEWRGATSADLAGINGSKDPTATEGTKSYTSSALSVASKSAQSIKDTPQSVSVITQQRMQDQNLTDFNSIMNQTTGVTVVAGNGSGTDAGINSSFYSRGFQINSIQIDGGAPLATSLSNGNTFYYYPQIDMAMYDHVEILRGADGVFNGYGTPSGSVNLARKRPLDHSQVVLDAQVGSWDNYRTVLDATAPLGFDGRLRGRAVMSYQDQKYFYDVASSDHTLAYGILEADLTPSTTLSGGFSYTRQDSSPWVGGLPRYSDGDDLHLPRSTCLCFDWNRWNFTTKEAFAQVDQGFGDNWKLNLKVTRNDQQSHQKVGISNGTINFVSGVGPKLYANLLDFEARQTLIDFTVDGAFELFGHKQQIVVGGSWQNVSGGHLDHPSLFSPAPALDVFHFDPNNIVYREPGASEVSAVNPAYWQKQWGMYANLRLTLLEPLHLITGLRYSQYDFETISQDICITQYIPLGLCNNLGQPWGTPSKQGYRDHDINWPPTVSLVYDLRKNWSVYGSYTDIYQPQANYLDYNHDPIGPLTGSNMEAGLKYGGPDSKLNVSLAAYRIEQKNFPGLLGETYQDLGNNFYCCYDNDGDRVNLSQGADLEATGELLPGWQLFAGYTFNKNEAKGADAYSNRGKPLVSRAPRHLLKLWTSYQLEGGEWLHRLNVGGGVNAQTNSYNAGSVCVTYNYDAIGNPTTCARGGTLNYDFTQGFYAVFSARLAFQIDSRWNAGLNINNITDRTYYQTVGSSSSSNWYGEPRNFTLTFRGNF
ncbi:MAG: TonB-dependent siderophore receptor [Gammaproteobacteria bacterium]